jgi:hypothetical protein
MRTLLARMFPSAFLPLVVKYQVLAPVKQFLVLFTKEELIMNTLHRTTRAWPIALCCLEIEAKADSKS